MNGIRFLIGGRVQGVGFRAWTRTTARELGLVGSVRNRPDGTVQVDAAGSSASLESFRAALHEGPPGARVASVTETSIQLDDVQEFTIQRW